MNTVDTGKLNRIIYILIYASVLHKFFFHRETYPCLLKKT